MRRHHRTVTSLTFVPVASSGFASSAVAPGNHLESYDGIRQMRTALQARATAIKTSARL